MTPVKLSRTPTSTVSRLPPPTRTGSPLRPWSAGAVGISPPWRPPVALRTSSSSSSCSHRSPAEWVAEDVLALPLCRTPVLLDTGKLGGSDETHDLFSYEMRPRAEGDVSAGLRDRSHYQRSWVWLMLARNLGRTGGIVRAAESIPVRNHASRTHVQRQKQTEVCRLMQFRRLATRASYYKIQVRPR